MKGPLRNRLLAARDALSLEERRRGSDAVVDRLQHLPVVRAAGTILGYHPLGSELDVLGFLQDTVRRGRRVALPRVAGDRLDLHAWHPDDDLDRSALRVREPLPTSPTVSPDEVDLVLVPGIAFDRRGHRLGYGRGFYDRLLRAVPRQRRVGLAFDLQVVDALPTEVHDTPVGWLVTPRATTAFSAEIG